MRIPRVWPVGLATIPVRVAQLIALPDGTGQTLEPVVETVRVWAIPWPQLLTAIGFPLIAAALCRRRKRSIRCVEIVVPEAREEGRRAARENA